MNSAEWMDIPAYKSFSEKEKDFVERLWAISKGYPVPSNKEYLETMCYPDTPSLDANWFYKLMFNLRVNKIIETFKGPSPGPMMRREARLYFCQLEETLKELQLGPYEPGAIKDRPCLWRMHGNAVNSKEITAGKIIPPDPNNGIFRGWVRKPKS